MDDETPPPTPDRVTALLVRWTDGDGDALDALMPLVYGELRKTAQGLLRRERGGHTLQPTALVHEAWMRLVRQDRVNFEHRKQFFGLAAQVMRRILVDHARSTQAAKRGGGAPVDVLEEGMVASHDRTFDLLVLDQALTELGRVDARQAQLIELRYFGGLTIEEVADLLGVSPATISRGQRAAEAWLSQAMAQPETPGDASVPRD
ncbi:MAG: sigma-70 family RNA polymerase sigma factor [Acidobacteria bacterium]|nr:sigma-70 family RNA polymerase sigma factor [Acidobacteriota bacterium]